MQGPEWLGFSLSCLFFNFSIFQAKCFNLIYDTDHWSPYEKEENTNVERQKRINNKEMDLKRSAPANLDNQMARNNGQTNKRMCVCNDSVDRDKDDNEDSIRYPEKVFLKFSARLKRPIMK